LYAVQVGSTVNEFDPVCEVQSDKANVEITSPYSGTIRKLYGEVGDIVKVSSTLRHANASNSNLVSI
jgi:2-oxoisovalerate dehydrogenase E2 component (dihydrolipoyl transacylase)